MSRMTFLGAIALSMFLSAAPLGCATIVKGGEQDISVKAAPGAKVRIYDRDGKKIIEQKMDEAGPRTATLHRGAGYFTRGRYRVVVETAGAPDREFRIEGSVNGWYAAGNFFFGGLLGYLVVDPLSGAMWTLSPDEIDATAAQGPSSP